MKKDFYKHHTQCSDLDTREIPNPEENLYSNLFENNPYKPRIKKFTENRTLKSVKYKEKRKNNEN